MKGYCDIAHCCFAERDRRFRCLDGGDNTSETSVSFYGTTQRFILEGFYPRNTKCFNNLCFHYL
jgi:hypothetical protein